MSFNDFIAALKTVRGISPLTERILNELREFCSKLSDDAMIFLAFLLALERDGNTLVSLDLDVALNKWRGKWSALRLMAQKYAAAEIPEELAGIRESFDAAIREIRSGAYPEIVGTASVPFIVGENVDGSACLYIQKYFSAKLVIEQKIKELFSAGRSSVPAAEIKKIQEDVFRVTGKIKLAEKQAQAIARGASDNLIITGGPGTGKTTVVFFILRALLKKPEYQNYTVYLAAPSGKAADRMQESIGNSLKTINANERFGTNPEIYNKVSKLEGSTIHRMLKYQPKNGAFVYNAEHPFPKESIFVIDEASMIDISLFASLLSAIPQGARVFLLGDKDQLPSVDAGAVLGELLAQKSESVVALTESRRFSETSHIGSLARIVNGAGTQQISDMTPRKFLSSTEIQFPEKDAGDAVNFIQPPSAIKEKETEVKKIVKKWAKFYDGISEKASSVVVPEDRTMPVAVDATDFGPCDDLWKYTECARILCAERAGETGVAMLNELICKAVSPEKFKKNPSKNFFGKIVMLNRNQNAYKLYNGDTGVLVPSPLGKDLVPFVMFKKGEIFVFHSLSAFPAEDIDTAFAITVHKSQGSEFENVLLFLPDNENHPLLTKQIIYTGITRARSYCAIVSTDELFQKGIVRVLPRDTGIVIE